MFAPEQKIANLLDAAAKVLITRPGMTKKAAIAAMAMSASPIPGSEHSAGN